MERSDVRWQKRRKNRCGKHCTVHIAKDPGYLGLQPMSMGITTWIRRNTCMYAAAILPVIHTLGHTKKVCVPCTSKTPGNDVWVTSYMKENRSEAEIRKSENDKEEMS